VTRADSRTENATKFATIIAVSSDDKPGDDKPAVSRTKSRKRGKKAGARKEKRPKTADDPAVARTEMRASSEEIAVPRTKTPAGSDEIAVARTKTPASSDAADTIALPRTMSEEWMAADVDDGAYEDDKHRPVWLIPAIAAAVVTIAIVGIFALRGSDSDGAAKPSVASTAPPQTEPAAAAPLPPGPAPLVADAALAVVAPADAAELAPLDAAMAASAPPAAPADAASAPLDAAMVAAVVPPDAAVRAAPPDAAVVAVHTAPPDAAPKPVEHVTPPKPPKPPPPPKDERSIEQLVGAGEFAKANTACADNTKFSTPRLEACAIAACQTHSTALAQRWVRAIDRSAAASIIDRCKALGVELAAP